MKTTEKQRAASRAWYWRNREAAREKHARWRRENPEKVLAANRNRRRYPDHNHKGLPAPTRPRPEFCECCGKPPGSKALALDHNHTTGEFRGWLCINCNTGIGKLGDSEEGLQLALNYLTAPSMVRQ